MTSVTDTLALPQKPAQWLEQLMQRGVLCWQHGETNLGLMLACLLDVNGWQGDILSLCDALPSTAHVVTVPDILAVMGALGFRVKRETISTKNLKAEDVPGLFIARKVRGWRAGYVIREVGPYGVIWEDGREQYRGALPDETGDFYRFERMGANDEATTPAGENNWHSVILNRFRPLIGHAVALSLAMHLFTLAMPIFSMAVYDRVIAAHAPGTLPLLSIGVLLALTAEHVIRWLRIRLAGWIGARSSLLATAAMFERLLFLPASIIEQASVSSQLARIRAFESVRDFITGPAFLSILEIPFLFILMLVIMWLAGPVVWVAFGIVLFQIALVFALHARWQHLGKVMAHAAAERQHVLIDITENIKPLYAAGLADRMLQRFRSVNWASAKANYRFGLDAAILQHFAGFVTVLAGVSTIAWSLNRIWAGEMTGGAMVATMIITWRILYPLQSLCAVMPQIEQIRASLQQVSQLMSYPAETHAHHTVLAEHKIKGRVNIQNLGLRYGRKSDPVFMGLSIDIEPGEIIAVYGGNGTGKSSILNLLLGLYPPAMGSIRLDGVDHRQFDPRSLRRQIAYLPQLPELFPGTVADNLRVQEPLAEDYKLRQALLWADAWDMIEQLPQGLETRLGPGGVVPSSGLAARILLARLYISERSIVLCDELPAQVLNNATGERFRKYLADCRGKRTVIFVTHRQDWLSVADKVLWLRADARPVVLRPDQLRQQI
ncbi:MAG TPA: ATP-binding cassette domain-containing protein [Alphaproteobacteria bacterium]|nr:ATP-binding cassette domain-containing protein [Alphaproteobacteria bacterium]